MSRYESLRQNEIAILKKIGYFLYENKIRLSEDPQTPSDKDIESFLEKLKSSSSYKKNILPYQLSGPTEIKKDRKSSGTKIIIQMNTAANDARKRTAIAFEEDFKTNIQSIFQKSKGYVVSSSVDDTVVKITVNGYRYSIKFAKPSDETSSDTDVKEGLSVFYAYYDKQSEPITIENYKEEVGSLLDFVKVRSNIYGISDSTYKKALSYLRGLVSAAKSKDMKKFKIYAATVNQNMSHGSTFEKFLEANPDFYVERDSLFEEIRRLGSSITGYPKDKWCPGDVYFIKNGGESEIDSRMSLAKTQMSDNKEQALATLNSLFSDKYLESVDSETPIVAVSLKMAEAQAGKLKSGFEEYANTPRDYSLDNDEMAFKIEDYRAKILDFKRKLEPITKSTDVDIQWKFVDVNAVKDLDTLRFKYAAYKTMYFILTKIAENRVKDFDEAIVSLTAYGLGMISKSKSFQGSVNPPFFKVIANKDGSYRKPTLFKGGTALGLINLSDKNAKPVLNIADSPNFKGLTIEFGLIIGSENFDIMIAFRSNGTKQLTVELAKAKEII